MQFLNLKENLLEKRGAIFTAKEISGQPKLWNHIFNNFNNESLDIENFLERAYQQATNIIVTGAGTSAFIGLSLQGPFFRNTGILTRAIATTDIVSHPQDYFNEQQIPLVISFARSGNSPESYAAINLADKFSEKCFHLVITCDKEGALAKCESENPNYVIILPEEANDKSLAMTGSYSGMLLMGLMIAYIQDKRKIKEQLDFLMKAAENIFSIYAPVLEQISEQNFKRAFFIGSGGLYGTATEAALKLQELTDGKIVCKTDTFLGLRHGPKAVIDENTLVVYFLSNNEYAKRYELDLINSMGNGNLTMFQLGVSENFEKIANLDAQVNFGTNYQSLSEDFLPVCAIIAGQLIGFYKSFQLGLNPDTPSVNGSISRVVKGVNIYPFEKEKGVVSGS